MEFGCLEKRRLGFVCDFWRKYLLGGVCWGGRRGALWWGLARTDDAVASEEMRVPLVHVHAPAHALARAVDAPHQLRHHLQRRPAPSQMRAMIAVGCDDGILLRQRRLHADAHSLLPVVEVAEPADELALVQHVGRDLEAAHEVRLREHVHDLRLARLHRLGRGFDVVRFERHRDVDGHRVVARRLLGEAALLLSRWDRGWEGNVSTRVREMGAGGRGVATARDAKVQDWKFEYGN